MNNNNTNNTNVAQPSSLFVLKAVAAVLALAAVGGGAWWVGMNQGMAMMAAPEAAANASIDPGEWTVPQGEDATRRHIRDGLKAGDVDPVTGRVVLNYHDPMVPGKNFDAPAKSPFMDMMLVPRYAGSEGADTGTVTVSPRIQQNLGLRTVEVKVGSLATEVVATGAVVWNERDQVVLQARATGFVEKLFVRATLDRVAAGAPLAEIYVPTWVAAQEEYLALARMEGSNLVPLRDAARQRMQLAGMDAALIQTVVRTGTLQPRYTLTAPQGGVMVELMLREGMTVMPGATLARIQGTQTVWAEGEVPESQAALLKPGALVNATSPAAPGQTFKGRVQTLLPEVNPTTRTVKARLEIANPSGQLVPGMFVQMRFAQSGAKDSLLVASDAVIHTGRRSVVMVAEEGGRFRPVEVSTGMESGGQIEILKGLTAGQHVVRSGTFLIDSEASLRGLETKLNQDMTGTGNEPQVVVQPTQAAKTTYPTHSTTAVVEAVDSDTVTLNHPAIAALKWPAMQMDFALPATVPTPRALVSGDQVQVEFHMQDGDMPLITSVRLLSPGAAK